MRKAASACVSWMQAFQSVATTRQNPAPTRTQPLDLIHPPRQIDSPIRPQNAQVGLAATKGDNPMSLGTILIIILIIFLLGGFSGRFGGYGYGFGHGGMGIIGTILIVVVVLLLVGRL